MSILRWIGQALGVRGDLLVKGDIRTRDGNTGGGDVFSRSLFAGPAGYYYITDPSGNRIGFLGPDGSPASFWLLSGGAPGSEVPGFQLDLATGLLTALNGLAVSNPLSTSVDALSFNDGTTDVGFRAYSSKSVSVLAIYADGTLVCSISSGVFTHNIQTTFSAAATFNSSATHAATVANTYAVSPSNLASNTNNWNPVGLGSTVPTNIRASCSAGVSITGLIAGTSGQRITIYNIGTTNAMSLAHQSGSSSAGNKFFCPGSTAFSIAVNGSVDLWYDPTSAGWRVISK